MWFIFLQKYKLIVSGDDLRNPRTFAFVNGGLKPLSVRFVELAFEKAGFRNIDKKSKFGRFYQFFL